MGSRSHDIAHRWFGYLLDFGGYRLASSQKAVRIEKTDYETQADRVEGFAVKSMSQPNSRPAVGHDFTVLARHVFVRFYNAIVLDQLVDSAEYRKTESNNEGEFARDRT
jgi:hypothetical protein